LNSNAKINENLNAKFNVEIEKCVFQKCFQCTPKNAQDDEGRINTRFHINHVEILHTEEEKHTIKIKRIKIGQMITCALKDTC
jgi:hypothetical protein